MCVCGFVCVWESECVLIIMWLLSFEPHPGHLNNNKKKKQFTAQPHVQKNKTCHIWTNIVFSSVYLSVMSSFHFCVRTCACICKCSRVCVFVFVTSFYCTQHICAKLSKAIRVRLRTLSVYETSDSDWFIFIWMSSLVNATLLKGTRASFCEIITKTEYLTH